MIRKTRAVPESIAGVALIAVSIAVSVTNTHIAYNPSMYGVYWKFMVSSLCGVIGWTLIMRRIPQNRMCTYIASTTIAILVMHKFPIVFFQTIVPVVKDYLFVNNIWVALIITVVVMVMCAVVERIISAFIPEVFGKPGKFSEKITARIARKG